MMLEKQAEKLYRQQLFVRHDNPDGLRYLSPEDVPGLHVERWAFASPLGHTLQAYFYHFGDRIPEEILVFDHGMGNGHIAYLREIAEVAKAGFRVCTYDHTGCMSSGGADINGFAQSLNDLDAFVKALKGRPDMRGKTFRVMGHSWGGFSAMNIAAFHPEVTHVVGLSGFVSVEQIQRQLFNGPMALWQKPLLELERRLNPGYADCDARVTLAETKAKVLLIYSADDRTIHKAYHYDLLEAALSGRENVRLVLLEGRDHNPTFTADAVAYKRSFNEELKRARDRKALTPDFMDRWDWERMFCQDPDIWQMIAEHLNS